MHNPAATHLHRAITAHRNGLLDQARQAYGAVLSLQPDNAVAHHNLALIDYSQGNPLAALDGLLRAVAAAPDRVDFILSLTEVARGAGWPVPALDTISQILMGQPKSSLALYSTLAEGFAFHGRSADEALPSLTPALSLTDTSPENWHNLAYHLLQLECLEAALAAIDKAMLSRAISLPQRLASLNLKAAILRPLQRSAEAIGHLQEATILAPEHAPTWNNLAALLRDQGDFSGADEAIRKALTLNPDYPAGLNTAASIDFVRQDFSRAQAQAARALALQPDYPEAHWNLALACLAQGEFAKGWSEYEWRRRLPGASRLFPELGLPTWQGEDLTGKTLLLYAEQGHGDTLQFIRLARPLAEQGIRVLAQVQPALVRLLSRCPWLAEVRALGSPPPAADFCLPLLSLPHRLDLRLETIPAPVPYLYPEPEEIAAWQCKLSALPGPRIGLVWAGDPRPSDPESNRIDQRRSLAFEALRPILTLPGFTFVSLQKSVAASQLQPQANLLDPAADLTDFAATAALVANLDAIVSVDTAVAHLAGGLGIPTLLLSRYDACWRWLGNRATSPWYPSLRLFAQETPGEWHLPIEGVKAELLCRFPPPTRIS